MSTVLLPDGRVVDAEVKASHNHYCIEVDGAITRQVVYVGHELFEWAVVNVNGDMVDYDKIDSDGSYNLTIAITDKENMRELLRLAIEYVRLTRLGIDPCNIRLVAEEDK